MKLSIMNPKNALLGLTFLGALSVQQPLQAAFYSVDDFSGFEVGQSIEGLGTVHELLNIDAIYGNGIALFPDQGHTAYGAYNADTGRHSDKNGSLNLGGFADKQKKNAFSFTFAEGIKVSEFSLNMLDYGDWNPNGASWHQVSLTAYNALGTILSQDVIEHQTQAGRTVGLEGDAAFTTDANRFGSTLLSVMGEDITKVELTFDNNGGREGYSSDPNVGFDFVSFTTQENGAASVPEPASTLALLAIGAVGVGKTLNCKQDA